MLLTIFLVKIHLRLCCSLLLAPRVSSMDPSIFKLLEEDEDDSMHSSDDVDAFQASLSREIEGENNSSSQQFATQSNGVGDANTDLHILESTQMKEQQRCVLGNQNQELKRENESQPQHNPPQDRRQPDQASNLQSRNNPISNEPERPQPQCLKLQKTSSQRAHGTEQPVEPVNHGPTEVQVCEFIRILIAQVNKDREKQLLALFYKFKRKEMTKETFLRNVRGVVGDQMARSATSTLHPLEQGNKGIKVPGRPNHHRESFTSAEISAKKPDPRGVHVNQPTSTSSGTLSSSATLQGSHNFERPTSVNGLSGVQGGPISHFQNNSSLPLYSAPCQGSVAKDQTVGPSSSVVHVKQISIDQSSDQAGKPCSLVQQDVSDVPMKQKNGNPKRSNDDLEKQSSKMVLSTPTTHASFVPPSVTKQLDSSTMVKSPAPSGTILTGANVWTTPKMPSAGQKKPLEALGSSQPPSSKRQKLRGTFKDRSIENFNDVTALSGINIAEEENKLLSSGPKKDGHVSKASQRVVHEEEERTIFQKVPLQRKLTEIMAKSGVKHMNDDVERCLSLCAEERMRGLLSKIIRISKQRTDAEKGRNRTCITSDIGKQIKEMNQKVKEEWDRKNGGEEMLKNGENDTAKEDNRSEQVKENKKEQDEKRAKAANVAALASIGGDDMFLKWKLMAEARQKPSSGTGRNSKKPSGETGDRIFGKSQGSPKVVRSISVKDVIAVVEREPQMSRSTLLYRLYNRICSDVPTQEKT